MYCRIHNRYHNGIRAKCQCWLSLNGINIPLKIRKGKQDIDNIPKPQRHMMALDREYTGNLIL